MSDNNEAAFWRAFRTEAPRLAGLIGSGQMRQAFDIVEALLREQGFDYCFDLTMDSGVALMILTPEGDPEEAKLIDRLLDIRPDIDGWQFFGRRQRKAVEDAFAFVQRIWDRDISGATFDVEPSGELTLYSQGLSGLAQDQVLGVIGTFLDHALGESTVMSRISGVAGRSEGVGHYSADAMVRQVLGH